MHTAKANSITRVQLPLTGGAEAVYYFHSDHLVAADLMFSASLSKHPMDVYYSPLRYRNIHRMFLHATQ